MKKIYLLLFTLSMLTLFSGCSRHFRSYQDRLADNWQLTKVKISKWDKQEAMAFTGGWFTFYPSGNLHYKDDKNRTYSGSWKMKYMRVFSSTDSSGSSVYSLFITLVDFENHEVIAEIFDDVVFQNPNEFRAYLDRNGRNIFYFTKQQ